MHSIILSLGGSLLYSDGEINRDYLQSVAPVLRQQNLGIVVGGGTLARDAANAVRARGGSEFAADEAAIEVTRENAGVLAKAIGFKQAVFCKDFASAARVFGKKIPVMGGVLPGLTTDAVAVLLAEKLGVGVVVNASKINGVYDKNPSIPGARLYERLTYEELIALAVKSDERRAGTNFVFDLIACKLAARSKIELRFVDGRDLVELKNALSGRKFAGTRVF